MNVVSIRSRDLACGSLLWIGESSLPEFQSAHQHCVRNVAQIALRETVYEALERPAMDVRWIVVARADRHPSDRDAFLNLAQQYSQASWVDLLGPLCEGVRLSSVSESMRVAWYRWDQVLPSWLKGAPAGKKTEATDSEATDSRARSVAIIASHFATAETYLDLASSHGVTAVWSATPDAIRIRNIEAVWWDDSIADSAESNTWRERVSTFETAGRQVRHAWITHRAWLDQQQSALAGGIDTIVSKPFRIDSLLCTLGCKGNATRHLRQAA